MLDHCTMVGAGREVEAIVKKFGVGMPRPWCGPGNSLQMIRGRRPVRELRSLASRKPIRRLAKELIDIGMTSAMAGGIDQCQFAS